MASVNLSSVRKSYGAVEVIHGVDLGIEDREFVALVGPSGCGKSTLLRMVAGLEEISDGEIAIGDKVVNDVPVRRRDVAMVFQNYALYPHMSVFDNLSFSLRLRKAEASTVDSQVGRASGILGIEGFLKRFPRQLSGGQRQRVAMGRAIVRNPQVFLFDEPLSNLDAKLRVQMRTEIKALHQRLQTTAIYVTHDQVEAMTMADRIVVMQGGHVEQVGAPLDLYDRPANRFVAGFIGSPAMNFLDGVYESRDGGPVVRLSGGPLDGRTVDAPRDTAASEGQPVVLGVRPEHLTPAEDGLPMEVEVIEPTGSETVVIFVPEGADRREGMELCATFYERVRMAPGDRVHLAPKLDEAHLFDAETGRRL